MNDPLSVFLNDYAMWKADRADLVAAEENGPAPRPGEWHDLEDGCFSLLARAVTLVDAAKQDRRVVDIIAVGLGVQDDWSGADCLEWIADAVGGVRPHPGNVPADVYADLFTDETGRPADI